MPEVQGPNKRDRLDRESRQARTQVVPEAITLLSRGEIERARQILNQEVERTEGDIENLRYHLQKVKETLGYLEGK